MVDKTEQLGFEFAVGDKASQPLGKIEKAYHSIMKTFDTLTSKLGRAMKSHSDGTAKVGEESEKTTKKFQGLAKIKEFLGGKIGKLKEGFGEMKAEMVQSAEAAFGMNEAFASMLKIMGTAGLLGALIGFVGFLAKAFLETLEFRREVAKLNEAFTMNKKEAGEVSGAVFSLSHSLGKSRQEAIGLVRSLLELGLTPKVAKDAGTSFKELAKITMDFSAATGASSESAARLTDQLLRINQVGSTNLRSIGFSIKNIADNSRITTDELIAMNEAMEPMFAHLSEMSADAKTAFTQNMLAIGGALSDVGIDGKKATAQFAEMLDETSTEGIESLAKLSMFTGKNTETLKEMIKSDPAAIFDELAKKSEFLRKTDPIRFKQMARDLQPLGLQFGELTKLAEKFGVEGSKSFKQTTIDLAAMEAKDKALSDAAKKRQAAIDGIMDKFKAQWDSLLLRVGGKLITKLVEPMMKRVIPAFEKLIDYLAEVDWDGIFSGAFDAINALWNIVKGFLSAVTIGFEVIGTVIGGVMAMVTGLWDNGISGMMDAGKELFDELAKLSSGWADSLLGIFDDILVNIGGLAGLVSHIPGIGNTMASGLSSIAKGAEERIKARKVEAERSSAPTADSSVRSSMKATSGPKPVASVNEVSMPSRMTTSSPSTDQLLREQNDISKKILAALRTNTSESASGAKSAKVMSFAGA